MIEVSIVTPCYNSAKYIKETYESILNQTFTNWEWIIVDDFSTDESREVIRSFLEDKRIQLISLTKNSGVAVARNTGIKIAEGRYLTFIDSDDLWKSRFLERTLGYIKEQQVEMVYTGYERKNENLEPFLPDFIGPNEVDFERLLYNCPLSMLTTIYDTQRIGKVLIPEQVDKREDHVMWFDVLKKIPKAHGISEVLAVYRIRKNSYSRNKVHIAWKQFLVYYKFLNLSLIKSIYYTVHWALNGLKKYDKI